MSIINVQHHRIVAKWAVCHDHRVIVGEGQYFSLYIEFKVFHGYDSRARVAHALAALTLVVVPIANALVDIIPRTRFPSFDMMRIEVKPTLLAS